MPGIADELLGSATLPDKRMSSDSFGDGNAWQVFVSYRRPKRDETGAFVGSKASLEVARWLESELEAREIEANTGELVKVRVFIDEDEACHSNWRDKLIPTLQYSRAIIVLLDRAAVKRKQGVDYLHEELELIASNPKRTPILLQLDTVSRDALVAQPKFSKWQQVQALPCYWDAWKNESPDDRAANLNRLIAQVRKSIRNLGSIHLAQQVEEIRQALERETEARKAETTARKKATRRAFIATLLLIAAVAAAAWAVAELIKANTALEGERTALFEAQKQRIIATANEKKAIKQEKLAKTKEKEAERRAYHSQIIAANELVQKDRIAEARTILFSAQRDLRDWEWGYLMQRCGPHPQDLAAIASVASEESGVTTLLAALRSPRSADATPFRYVTERQAMHWGGLVSIQRKEPQTTLLNLETPPYVEVESLTFANRAPLALIKADSFRTNFGDAVDASEDSLVVVSLPDRFNLHRLGRNRPWRPWPGATLQRGRVVLRGPGNDEDHAIEVILEKGPDGFQLASPKNIDRRADDMSGFSWLDANSNLNRAIPSELKKVWSSRTQAGDGIGRQLGDRFEMDGTTYVPVVRSDHVVEVWSLGDATLRWSYGESNGERCRHEALSEGKLKLLPGCLFLAASAVNVGANRIFAWDSIYDLTTRERVCVLQDSKGKPASQLGFTENEGTWAVYSAQLDARGEFLAVRVVGKNGLEGFGIWDAKSGHPLLLRGDLVNAGEEEQQTMDWGEGNIPGGVEIHGLSWTADGSHVVVVNAQVTCF
jgi:hypothetical protein